MDTARTSSSAPVLLGGMHEVAYRGGAPEARVAVAAMADPLVHHAEVIALKGDSYRLKGRGKEMMAAAEGS